MRIYPPPVIHACSCKVSILYLFIDINDPSAQAFWLLCYMWFFIDIFYIIRLYFFNSMLNSENNIWRKPYFSSSLQVSKDTEIIKILTKESCLIIFCMKLIHEITSKLNVKKIAYPQTLSPTNLNDSTVINVVWIVNKIFLFSIRY